MKLIFSMVCLLAATVAAHAQYGVSNARDANGNLIRDSGMNSPRDYTQPPVNNSATGANRANQAPGQSIGIVPGSANGVRR